MADRSFEPLPPGWGALSMVRASRRRSSRWPWIFVSLAVLVGVAFAIGWISRA
jgi:hypothetical protein